MDNAGGPTSNYEWIFNGFPVSTDMIFEFCWTDPGTYDLLLITTDNFGNSYTTEQIITVGNSIPIDIIYVCK